MEFTPENKKKVSEILKRYPEGKVGRQAALLPLLRLAQEQFGFVSEEVMTYVASILDIPPAQIYGVATFYTLFNKKPVGKYHLQVCTNLSCCMEGAEETLSHLEKRLCIRSGETTPDGKFTLSEVECLAACGSGPVIQVNEEYHEDLKTTENVDRLLERLK
ncbi:MAG: NAD(P)H-dependent oxidoreductase subunit E [Deltaproteobacteria bacterium]|nr:NAD(P)H-dependent oxidoreductase subunit E [Deltaproteobacteria bacterium]